MGKRSELLLSKGPAGGQWRRGPGRLFPAFAVFLCAQLPPALACAAAKSAPAPAEEAGPRYATLKSAPVNGRVGPGEDYKALWTFQAKGVPVQIVEETPDWRRICDPEGGLAWVRARALDNRRTVMRVQPSDLPMRRRPSADSRVSAVLAARATASLQVCRGGWCKISVDHASGWVRPQEVWGVAEGRQCR